MKKTEAAAVERPETCTQACAPTPKRRGRPLSFDRDKALDNAMHVFWEMGYEGASITALTTAMGITPPSLYAAFGDKEHLFLEAVERYMGPAKGCPAEAQASARGAVEGWLREAAVELTSSCHPRGCMVMTAATACSSSSKHILAKLADHLVAQRQAVCKRIKRGIDEGELPTETDAAALADFYVTVVQGMSFQARSGASRETLLVTVDVAMRAWPDAGKSRSTVGGEAVPSPKPVVVSSKRTASEVRSREPVASRSGRG
jgi:AcrR family transcriptional regulator